jgi:hypothetical protein
MGRHLGLRCTELLVLSFAFVSAPGNNVACRDRTSSRSLPATDEVRITDISGREQTNRPVSISRPFVKGEVPNFAQASLDGKPLLTQCDVKNRWPDGSLKFAIVSFIVPRIPAKGSVVVTFSNQSSGNNTGHLAKGDLLTSAYNFDAQIQLTGTANHRISARSILTAADSCDDPGNDVDAGRYLCTFWLRGPIVTAVILEDRTTARSFDVNTDGLGGNPLHPIFEAWFYPQNNAVQLGYTLEDDWASTNPVKSARDQSYSLVLTGGNIDPVVEYTNGTFKQVTRSRWHKTFWLNQADRLTSLTVDHNWPYLAQTRFLPHWDTNLQIAASLIAAKVKTFSNSSRVLEGCSNCYSGEGGIGNFQKGLNAGGAADWHGPLTTCDIIYLISQNPGMYNVMIGNADLGGRIPYFYREADANAGHGYHFDVSSRGSVQTFGRVVSINSRTQVSLDDTTTQNQCSSNYPEDWINFGGSGQDTDGWNTDTSHWPNLAYAAYLSTGHYAYYEEQIMQSAYAIADSPGTRGCAYNGASSRGGANGYWQSDQERQQAWMARENALGAFIALDGSPEKAYLEDKLRGNLAVWEGSHGVSCDIPGTGVQQPYCGSTNSYYAEGTSVRTGAPWSGTALGSWTTGICTGPPNCYNQAPLNLTGAHVPVSSNSSFMNAYSSVVIGWINDLGYCPGTCALLQFVANRYINMAMNPAANIYNLADYVYPTLDQNGNQIASWVENQALYASQPSKWGPCSISIDEGYAQEGMAVLAYSSGLTSTVGGTYSGSEAYNKVRATLGCINNAPGADFASGSPKWDITPR